MTDGDPRTNLDYVLLDSADKINRALALLAATALTSEHLQPADRTTDALGQLLKDTLAIIDEVAEKLDAISRER